MTSRTAPPKAAAALSGHLDTVTAATEVAHEMHDQLGTSADLVVMFCSFHHRAAFADAASAIRRTLAPQVMLGVTAEGVLGGNEEREGLAGLTAIALRMPGVRLCPWTSTPKDPIRISRPETIPQRIGLDQDVRAVLMLADPFSTPITRLLPALTDSGGDGHPVPVIGGMASGASQPGHNSLVLNDNVLEEGAVGVTILGDVEIECILSQGCRPIGKPMVITKCRDNMVLQLGGHRATEVVQALTEDLSDEDRQLLSQGLLVGTVIDEYKSHFGRGDFLVRNVLGISKEEGGMAIGELGRVGQTLQFHVRDANTAAEDLHLLLDGQQLKSQPYGMLLFTCNGRGTRLFGERHHDINLISERLGEIPIAGFFAAGELGPIGDRSFLHGQTASLALFRSR